jgi:hypothetical protein
LGNGRQNGANTRDFDLNRQSGLSNALKNKQKPAEDPPVSLLD